MPHTDQLIQLIIIAVAGAAVVMQAVILALIFFSVKKAVSALQEEVADLRAAAIPVLRSSHDFLTRVAPKIEATTTDVAELVHGLRDRIAVVESSTTEIVARIERQTIRMDTMLTGVLDSLERASAHVAAAVNKPLRQLAGVLASIKAVVETLRSPLPPQPGEATPPGEDEPSI
jgi:hypothetical protein